MKRPVLSGSSSTGPQKENSRELAVDIESQRFGPDEVEMQEGNWGSDSDIQGARDGSPGSNEAFTDRDEGVEAAEYTEHMRWSIRAHFFFPLTMSTGLLVVALLSFVPVYVLWSNYITTSIVVLEKRITETLAFTENYELRLLSAVTGAITRQLVEGQVIRNNRGSADKVEQLLSSVSSSVFNFPGLFDRIFVLLNGSFAMMALNEEDGSMNGAFLNGYSGNRSSYALDNSSFFFSTPLNEIHDKILRMPYAATQENSSFVRVAIPWDECRRNGTFYNGYWNTHVDTETGSFFTLAVPFVVDQLGVVVVSVDHERAFEASAPLFKILKKNGRAWMYDLNQDRVVFNSWGDPYAVSIANDSEFHPNPFLPLTTDRVSDPVMQEVFPLLKSRMQEQGEALWKSGNSTSFPILTSIGKMTYSTVLIDDGLGMRLACNTVILGRDFTKSQIVVRIVLSASITMFMILIVGATYIFTRVLSHPLKELVKAIRLASSFHVSLCEAPVETSRISDIAIIQRSHANLVNRLAQLRLYVPQAVLATLDGAYMKTDTSETTSRRGTMEAIENSSAARPIFSEPLNSFKARTASVMFIDCAWSASYMADKKGAALTYFFHTVRKCAAEFEGIIEVLRPDHIIISFGAHISLPMHAGCACKCAVALYRKLPPKDQRRSVIAIDTGEFQVGTCGAFARTARVVLGTQHLSIIAGELRRIGCHIGVTMATASHLSDQRAYPVHCVQLPRSREQTILYELAAVTLQLRPGMDGSLTATVSERITYLCEIHRQALSSMRRGDYITAETLLKQVSGSEAQADRLLRVCSRRIERKDTSPYVKVMQEVYRSSALPVVKNTDAQWSAALGAEIALAQEMTDTFNETRAARRGSIFETAEPSRPEEDADNMTESDGALFELASGSTDHTDTIDEAAASNTGAASPNGITDRNGRTWTRSQNKISEGAFSEVYLGISEEGEQVALKCIPRRRRDISEESLASEVEVASKLRHPNIVRYISYSQTAAYLTLVMEYVPGGSLHGVIESFGKLTATAARRFMTDILRGLRHLHSRGIVHCDVKPHNVLLGMDGVCKLTDFGSTISETTERPRGDSEDVLLRGTAMYMAPEVARGDQCTPQSDVFSLGVSLVEMLTGQLPWVWTERAAAGVGPDDLTILIKRDAMFAQALGRGEVAVSVPEDLGPDVRAFAQACCKLDPAKRPSVLQLQSYAFML